MNCKSDGVFAADLHHHSSAGCPVSSFRRPRDIIGAVFPGTKTGIVISGRARGVGAADQAAGQDIALFPAGIRMQTAQRSLP